MEEFTDLPGPTWGSQIKGPRVREPAQGFSGLMPLLVPHSMARIDSTEWTTGSLLKILEQREIMMQ